MWGRMADEKEIDLKYSTPKDKKIAEPVLYVRKAFSPLHLHKHAYKKSVSKDFTKITTENTAEHLEAEAEKESLAKNAINSSYEAVAKQRSTKKRWLSFGFLMLNLVILAIILFFQIRSEGAVSLTDLLASKMNWWWLVVGVLLFLFINVVDSMRIAVSIKKVTGRWRPILSYKSTVICRFYDCVTPLSTGGQPFQIYYLNKRGLNGSTASSVPLSKYVYAQLVFIVYTGIILLISVFAHMPINTFLLTLSWIGLILNALIIFAVFFLSISKKFAPRLMIGILKLGSKMRLVKDYRVTFRKLMRTVKEYTATFKMFMKSGWNAFFQVLLSIIYLTAMYTIPFVIYCMFNTDVTVSIWFQLLVLQVVCDLAISFIPLPGGAGTAELSFGALFSEYFKKSATGITVWAMLFWRILTYYGYLLQGAILLLYDFLIGNKRIEPLLQKYRMEDRTKVESLHYSNAEILKKSKKSNKDKNTKEVK